MDKEFVEAYEALQKDPQPVNLTLRKSEAWLLLTPIQLTSKHTHSKNSAIIQKAIKVGKAIQTLLVGDSKILTEVADAGWQGRAPKVSLPKFQAEFSYFDKEEIKLQLTKEQVWCVIASSQLAHRHPEYACTHAAQSNKQILDQLLAAIPEGILSAIAKAGWDTRLDQPIDRKGFGR